MIAVIAMAVMAFAAITVEAATFSDVWFQNADGTWSVRMADGSVLKDAWFCDDAVPSNGKDIWYLIDKDGKMMSAGLVQDGTGNYYSLEMEHNGFYGMLRYKSGTYDGVSLQLESQHNGSFAAIRNADGIEALKAKYGVTKLAINNSNIVYSSTIVSGTPKQNKVSGGTLSAGADWESIRDALIRVGSKYTGIPNVEGAKVSGTSTVYLLYNKYYGSAVKAMKQDFGDAAILVNFNSEWADQTNNYLYDDPNIPYYEALEPLYEDVLVTLLGSGDGEEFFQQLKANADVMASGGYFINPDYSTVWLDQPFGDGLNGDRLDLSSWQNRIAENGLRYSIVLRNLDAISIKFFK